MSTHLTSAVMRRYVDEPDALLSFEKVHLLECLRCRHELEKLRESAAAAARALELEAVPPSLASARAAILSRAAEGADIASSERPMSARASLRGWFAAAAAAVVLLLFAYAPFRAYAANLLTIFQPTEIAPITMTHADLTQMRDMLKLDELGTVEVSGGTKPRRFSSLAALQAYAHEPLLHPAYLPSTLAHTSDFQAFPRQTVRFTFDARKAKANAARKHQTLPAPPAGVDGSTLTAAVSPFVMQVYGTKLPSGAHTKSGENAFPRNAIVLLQGRVPAVHSNGASVEEIESYLLSLPNVPQDVKAQIRAIRAPADTLPVPVGVNKASAQSITIRGAHGILIGDNTGVGSVVIWLADGTFYSVEGGFTADEVAKVANSLTQ